ncbi:carbohydrate ABC transporter permease [Paenibacillus chitinolyticus]|uniref:Carbohydrate ABC transporter permease n=1 Tax=Paenibacillus chitinolyticus TaxID=79263 RepID=A0A410WTK6_9BACL|nr:carbohydrate ABC transporter permease [Paenibacillus chitinolyticus]MCY9593131.1 carbohydrate ABC transporter permease [Paenibacillus chitinolyticus]MCY9599035.1 carbohydrate ABC transporter permease [Paenibacillus chitinolyticus]QAV17715.1 carbohydrate ABC transporter permease [Paenibacillus chitinolyticus]GKS09358.1 sugar ABC transporter permease [Paenibacillus chitinolyticus]
MSDGLKNPFWRIVVNLLLIVWAIMVLYPLVWTVLGSLKDNQQFFQGNPWDLPQFPLLFSNFSYVWDKYQFGGYFMNSIIVTVVSVLAGLVLSSMTAYILARFAFKGSGVLYYVYIASMMIPMFLGMIPLFFLMSDMGLTNSLLGLIIVYTVSTIPFSVFVLVGFFKTLPSEIEEAAMMDGASYYGIFFRIMMPLAKPGLISVSIINVLNTWNEYILGVVLNSEPSKYTLPVGIAVMQGEMQYRTEWGPLFAALLISMVPVMIFYLIFQRQIASGITAGAVK